MTKEFQILRDDFNKKYLDQKEIFERNGEGKYSFSILGSPLKKTEVLIIGNNWGGSSLSNQKEMPLINDLLLYPDSPTYAGTIKFLNNSLKSDPISLIKLFVIGK